jgi:rhodanese-related sulfurtransferase
MEPNPSPPLAPGATSAADVLRQVDSTLFMKTSDWLAQAIEAGRDLLVLDLRAVAAYRKGHIRGSVQVSLHELPDRIEALAARKREVVCVCNGSVQSAMAVVFLRTAGFESAFNLSGGMSAWERQGRPLEDSPEPAPSA